jgi:hypothetical protein
MAPALPAELWIEILSHVPIGDLWNNTQRVSRHFAACTYATFTSYVLPHCTGIYYYNTTQTAWEEVRIPKCLPFSYSTAIPSLTSGKNSHMVYFDLAPRITKNHLGVNSAPITIWISGGSKGVRSMYIKWKMYWRGQMVLRKSLTKKGDDIGLEINVDARKGNLGFDWGLLMGFLLGEGRPAKPEMFALDSGYLQDAQPS